MVRLFHPGSLGTTDSYCAAAVVSAKNDGVQEFGPGAFIPNFDTLRPLSSQSVRLPQALAQGDFVYLGRLPRECLETLRVGIKAHGYSPGAEVASLSAELLKGAGLDPNLAIRGPIGWNGMAFHPGGLASTTIGPENRYLGFHFDDFEGREIEGRELLRQRICVNLGQARRGFSFWPIAMREVLDAIRGSALDMSRSSEVTAAAFRKGLIQEIVTVSMEPGEFYVAPTENILHDGNTRETEHVDISFTVRANVEIRARSLNEVTGHLALAR